MKKRVAWLCIFFVLSLFWQVPQKVQAKEYPYLLEVNLTQNVVVVYKKDENGAYTVPERIFLCSVGGATPTGTFRTSDKYTWRPLFGNVYGQYATRITGHILFHSIPYLKMYDKGSMEYQEYEKLGTSVSMGCVRLTAADAKWIYDNCPSGTMVRIVRSDAPLPLTLQRPPALDTTDTTRRGWDPTDPDPANPWHEVQQTPKFRFDDISVKSGETTFDIQGLYQEGSYFLSVYDAKKVFQTVEKKLPLPAVLGIVPHQQGSIQIKDKTKTFDVGYIMQDGVPYYKLRDLADMTETKIAWNEEEQSISVFVQETEQKQKSWIEKLILYIKGTAKR